MSVPPEQMLEVVRSKHALRPDIRFIGAIAEAKRVVREKAGGRLDASYASHAWTLKLDGEDVGALSDTATFKEAFDLLRVWATRLLPSNPGLLGAPPEGPDFAARRVAAEDPFSTQTIEKLEALDRGWSKGIRTPEALDLTGRSLTTLCLQSLDRVGIADPLYAKALALLAIREAAQNHRLPEEEALLASLMDYQSDAEALADPLPTTSPARMWVSADLPRFQAEAERDDASPRLRYLFLLRFAAETRLSDWSRWVETHCPELKGGIPLARAALELHDFGPDVGNAQMLLNVLFLQLTDESKAVAFWRVFLGSLEKQQGARDLVMVLRQFGVVTPKPPPGILRRFEDALASKTGGHGAIFDKDTERAYYRCLFYSALYTIGIFELDRRSSTPGAFEFARFLEGGPKGPAADFARWYGDLARVQSDTRALPLLLEDLDGLDNLGQSAIVRTADEARSRIPFNDPQLAILNERMERRFDARRASRLDFGANCVVTQLSLPCNERFYLSAVRMYGAKWYETFPGSLSRTEGQEVLARLVEDRSVKASARMTALQILDQKNAIDGERLTRTVLRIAEEDPTNGEALNTAFSLLRDHGRLKEAEGLARRRFGNLPDHDDLPKAHWASLIAETVDAQGRSAEAMTVIAPWVATGKSEAMGAAAWVLESLGRHEEAMAMAREQIDRYPDEIWGRAEMAALLWRQDRPNEVPRLFQDPRQPPSGFDWSGAIGQSFQRSFAKRSIADIEAAFVPLIQAGINPWYLVEMAKPMARSGRPDAAFAMLTAVTTRKPTGLGALDPRFNAYRYLKAWKGNAAAEEWVRSVVTPGFAFAALAASLDEGLIDVFWLIPDPPAGPGEPGVKLMRAVAVVLAPSRARQDAKGILRYFESGKRSPQADYAFFLIGAKPTSEFLSLARDPARRGAVAYYLGIQAIGRGDYETASEWLEACIEIQTHSREFDSASLIIRRWIESPRGFAEMKANPFP